jgi:hypothetical protein
MQVQTEDISKSAQSELLKERSIPGAGSSAPHVCSLGRAA